MIFTGIESNLHRGEDYNPQARLWYVDEEVIVSLLMRPILLSFWQVGLSSFKDIGLRHREQFDPSTPMGIPADLVIAKRHDLVPDRYVTRPSLPLWRRLSAALVDGFLNWTGTDARLLDDTNWLAAHGDMVPPYERSGITLQHRPKVIISGGYVGGEYVTGYETSTWLEPSKR